MSAAAEITELIKRRKKQAWNAVPHEHKALSINYVISEGAKKRVKGQSAETLDIIDIWMLPENNTYNTGTPNLFPKPGKWRAKMKAREDKRRKEVLLPPPPIIACKRQVSADAEITEPR